MERSSTAPPHVAEFEDVTITSEGILFRGGAIMGETFARAENFRRWKRKRGAARYEQNVEFRPTRRADSIVWVTDDWSKGYFHWLADVMPKLVTAADDLTGSTVLLPARFRDSDLVRESLELLGVHNVEFIADGEAVAARRVYFPFHAARSGEFDEAVIGKVRGILRRAVAAGETSGRRIYISRDRAKRRKVVNESEVAGVLSDFGFEKVVAEALPFAEQIRLFSSVSRLVSIHGAGLSNMLFMPPGGRVMEFRKDDPRSDECFSSMAAALGHKFYDQPCRASLDDQAPYSADLIVDTRLLESSLPEFLAET